MDTIENTVYQLKPRTLPSDIIVARKRELKSMIARQMLRHAILLSDPLNIQAYVNNHSTSHKPTATLNTHTSL